MQPFHNTLPFQLMIKQICNIRRIPTVLRGAPTLHQVHTRVATPHVRYFNTGNIEKGKKYSNKSDIWEFDLLASSLGLIVTLTAIYFITPKIETKRPRQRLKDSDDPASQSSMMISEKNTNPSTDGQPLLEVSNSESTSIQSQDEQHGAAKTLDVADMSQEKPSGKDHIEVVEMIVPGDINILNPYKSVDEGEKVETKNNESNKIPFQQEVEVHHLEEELSDDKKDCRNGVSEKGIDEEVNIPLMKIEPLVDDKVMVGNSIPDITTLNKDTVGKIESNNIENTESRVMVEVDSDEGKGADPAKQELNGQEQEILITEDSSSDITNQACEKVKVGFNPRVTTEVKALLSDSIPGTNRINGLQNDKSTSPSLIDVESTIVEQPSMDRKDSQKNSEQVTRIEIDEQKPVAEHLDKSNIPVEDMSSSLIMEQNKNIPPQQVADASLVIDECVEDPREVSNLETSNERKEEQTTQLDDTDSLPYQDTPLSFTEDQAKDILSPSVRETLSKNRQDNDDPSSSGTTDEYPQTRDNRVDVISKHDNTNEEMTGESGMIEKATEKKLINTDINEGIVLANKVESSEDKVLEETIDTKQKPVDEVERAYDPDTGEINWDCPCLGGLAQGPCGEEFKLAFSCFVYSEKEPKGSECISKFQGMQSCFQKHPDYYRNDNDAKRDTEEDTVI